MTAKRCPGCGHELTEPKGPCPTCGYRKDPEFVKKLIQFFILFAILGVLWIFFLTKDLWSG